MRTLILVNTFYFIIILADLHFVTAAPESPCDGAVHLFQSNFSVLSYLARFYTKRPPPATKCIWTIVGDENCDIDISCKINIPKQVNQTVCLDDSIRITDGSEGEIVACGEADIHGLRATEKLRDIFVVLETTKPTKNISDEKEASLGEVECIAKCGIGKALQRLPRNMKRKLDHSCVCGLQNRPVKMEYAKENDVDVQRNRRIVGGKNATMNEFPWNVALVFKGTRKPFCSGSIVNSDFILTAAHCFFRGNSTPQMEVLLHVHVLDLLYEVNGTVVDTEPDLNQKLIQEKDAAESTKRFEVLDVIIHPLFSIFYLDFDVALVQIKPVQLNISGNSTITPVCLPKSTTWDSLMPSWTGRLLTSVGWGKSAEDSNVSMAILQKLEDIPYIPFEKCFDMMPEDKLFRWNKRILCAGYAEGGKDTCQGDSGAGLSIQGKLTQQHMQIGIVSWGEGCARNETAGIYSRVSEFMQWIHYHSGEQSSTWCLEEKGY